MQPIKANELLQGVGALAQNPDVTSVVTDSRKACEGSLFVCIKGERTDGHIYAAQTIKQGAVGIVAQHAVEGVPAEKTVIVTDPYDALITMGGNYRAKFSPLLVGVTGSVGKTTTKEFCYAVFSAFGKTLKTEGNANNEIGMPATLFRLDDDTKYAVIEMGMQGLGEIEKLTLAAKPMGAIITCIGVSHIEQLGSRKNILKAKMEICEGMPHDNHAPLVINGDDDILVNAEIPQGIEAVYFALDNKDADVTAERLETEKGSVSFTIVDKKYGTFKTSIPTLGRHNVRDALSAYALATRLGLDAAKAAEALKNYQTTGHRQNMVVCRGVTVIEDCYNASPDSMHAALDTLANLPITGRRVAVLGDMFELGALTKKSHEDVGEMAAKANVSMLLTVGEASRDMHKRAVSLGVPATHCADKNDAVALLLNYCREGDAVLVKASHGMAFETILADFYGADKTEEE